MKVDVPLAFIHVFCDPNKLHHPDGVTNAKLQVAELQLNEGLELAGGCNIFDDAKDLPLGDGALSEGKIKEESGDFGLLGGGALEWYKGEKNRYEYGVYKYYSNRAKVVEMLSKSVVFKHYNRKSSALTSTHTYADQGSTTLASKVAHDATAEVNYTTTHQHNAKDQSGGVTEVVAFNSLSIVQTLQVQMEVDNVNFVVADDIDYEVFSTNITSNLQFVDQDSTTGAGKRNLAYLATRLSMAPAAKRKEQKKESGGAKKAQQAEEGGGFDRAKLTTREHALISFFVPRYSKEEKMNLTQFKAFETYFQFRLKELMNTLSDDSSSDDEHDEDEDGEGAKGGGGGEGKGTKRKAAALELPEIKLPEIMTKDQVFGGDGEDKRLHSELSSQLRMYAENWAKTL